MTIHVIPLLESDAFHKCNCSGQFVYVYSYVLSHFHALLYLQESTLKVVEEQLLVTVNLSSHRMCC